MVLLPEFMESTLASTMTARHFRAMTAIPDFTIKETATLKLCTDNLHFVNYASQPQR